MMTKTIDLNKVFYDIWNKEQRLKTLASFKKAHDKRKKRRKRNE